MNGPKRILFTNGRPTPPITLGGDSVSVKILLEHLSQNGYECFAFGTLNPEYSNRFDIHNTNDIRNRLTELKIQYKFSKNWLKVTICNHNGKSYLAIKRSIEYNVPFNCKMVRREYYLEELEIYVKNIKPDVIITQVDPSEQVILMAKKYDIPVILIIQDTDTYNLTRISAANSYHKANVVFISEALKKQFEVHCKVPTFVWYHPLEHNVTKNKNKGKYITMVNPVYIKGGTTFHDIAKSMPDEKFIAVTNWVDPIRDGVDFSDTKNLKVHNRVNDMDLIYKKTKLLLVPSLWQEGFGRVAIEAGSYGIPTIASNTGGLREAVGKGGIIIDDFINISQWTDKIKSSLKKDTYSKLKTLAYKHSLSFSKQIQGKKFESIINKVVK